MAILNETVFFEGEHRCIAHGFPAPWRTLSFGDMNLPGGEDGDVWEAHLDNTYSTAELRFATICPASLEFRISCTINTGDPSPDYLIILNEVPVQSDGFGASGGVKTYTMTLTPNPCGNTIRFVCTNETSGSSIITVEIL
jgi:hypothetical protein